MTKPLDPVRLREEEQRLRQAERAAIAARTAIDALLWFQEYAVAKGAPGPGPHPLVSSIDMKGVRLVASATPSADVAQRYLTRAALPYAEKIILDAIGLAQADVEAARG